MDALPIPMYGCDHRIFSILHNPPPPQDPASKPPEMFRVRDVLVSDEIADVRFACNLAACHGACCVQGASGAPLEPDECEVLEELYPKVKKYLSPEAIHVVEQKGMWERVGKNHLVTTCVGDAECVFVTYEGPVAKCSLQKAFFKNEIDFPKPISCHLFPIRVSNHGEGDVLNYEEISICKPAISNGRRLGVAVAEFLRDPLVRKYGEEWYEEFLAACAQKRSEGENEGMKE